jgi:hypothetical protein
MRSYADRRWTPWTRCRRWPASSRGPPATRSTVGLLWLTRRGAHGHRRRHRRSIHRGDLRATAQTGLKAARARPSSGSQPWSPARTILSVLPPLAVPYTLSKADPGRAVEGMRSPRLPPRPRRRPHRPPARGLERALDALAADCTGSGGAGPTSASGGTTPMSASGFGAPRLSRARSTRRSPQGRVAGRRRPHSPRGGRPSRCQGSSASSSIGPAARPRRSGGPSHRDAFAMSVSAGNRSRFWIGAHGRKILFSCLHRSTSVPTCGRPGCSAWKSAGVPSCVAGRSSWAAMVIPPTPASCCPGSDRVCLRGRHRRYEGAGKDGHALRQTPERIYRLDSANWMMGNRDVTELSGVGKRTAARLAAHNLRTVADLALANRDSLAAWFGPC